MNKSTELLETRADHTEELWESVDKREPSPNGSEYYPEELQELKQWILWREEQRNGKPTKVPYDIRTGQKASPTDQDTWSSFELVCERLSGYSGFGFVFSKDDPYVGIDLDNCRDPETGNVEPWALNIVRQLDSFTEISPSGTGLHIIGIANKPGFNCRTGKLPLDWNAGENAGVEVYDKDRYFAMSGYHLPETPAELRDISDALEKLYFTLWPKNEPSVPTSTALADQLSDMPDPELIRKALSAENGDKFRKLWEGDSSSFESPSEADQALCNHLAFWTGGDANRIDRLFRKSGLCRSKWTQRADYRKRTIESALSGTTNFYSTSKDTQTITSEDVTDRVRINIRKASDIAPRRVEWLWPSRIARGKQTLIAGDMGVGKSTITIDIASRKTAGIPWPDEPEKQQTPGNVVILTLEDDPEDTIVPRLIAHGADLDRVDFVESVTDRDSEGKPIPRAFDLRRDMKHLEKVISPETVLIIIDPISEYFGDTDTHMNSKVRSALLPVNEFAKKTGAAIIGITHLRKTSDTKALYRVMGSNAFTAVARSVWLVEEDKDDESDPKDRRRLFLHGKSNLASLSEGLGYHIRSVMIEGIGAIGRLHWEKEKIPVSDTERLLSAEPGRPATSRKNAEDFLRSSLKDGPKDSKYLREVAKISGIDESAIYRAKDELGVVSDRKGKTSTWSLSGG